MKPKSSIFGALWIGSEFMLDGNLLIKSHNGFYTSANIDSYGKAATGWPIDVKTSVQLTEKSKTKY
jgi:hypothetical protein